MKAIIALVVAILMFAGSAIADSGWVMCQPDSEVNIRGKPSKHSDIVAHAYMGDELQLDGQRSGRWIHCIVPCENGEGWIREDFLSLDEPEDLGSGVCQTTVPGVWARHSIAGKARKKLKKGTQVELFFTTAGWSVTSYGFIMTKFLEEIPAGDDGG